MRHSIKLKTLVTIGLLTFCCSAWGQDSLKLRRQPFIIRDLSSKTKIDFPLYIIKVDNKDCQIPASRRFTKSRQVKRTFKNFNPDLVLSIDVIKGQDATDKYGTLGKYGVIVINMKENTYDTLPRKLKRGCK